MKFMRSLQDDSYEKKYFLGHNHVLQVHPYIFGPAVHSSSLEISYELFYTLVFLLMRLSAAELCELHVST